MMSTHADGERVARRAFFGGLIVLFAAGSAATIAQHASMAAMGGLPMPGGWTMSMTWMRPCGRTWADAAAGFAGMWGAMTVAMMVPVLAPMLWRYRQAVGGAGAALPGWLAACAGLGYFTVWAALGVAVFPAGIALAFAATRLPALARAAPFAAGAAVLIAGAFQFTRLKARRLACCRLSPEQGRRTPARAGVAWRHGVHLGFHCAACCANLMVAGLAAGMMDIRVMAVVTVAIAVERLARAGERIARVVGAGAIGAGMWLIAHAAGLA